MNYELAKELKDAGFPQGHTEWDYAFHESPNDGSPLDYPVRVFSGSKYEDWDTYVAAPTLEELIEACGKKFDGLQINHGKTSLAERWQAYGIGGLNQFGTTPTEAVARLWLALNKK